MSEWLSDGLEEKKKEEAEREEKKFKIKPWPADWPFRKINRPSRSEPPSLRIPSPKPVRRRTVALAMVMMAGEFYVT